MNVDDFDFENAIKEVAPSEVLSAQGFENGPKINPLKFIMTYDDGEWEDFIEEWIYSLKSEYLSIMKPRGAGDKGIDVAGFADENQLQGTWDNYQCKHYSKPLSFSDIAVEVGKILWYSYQGTYVSPRTCRFIAPRGASTPLDLLLGHAKNLKTKVIDEWEKSIGPKITKKQDIALDGEFEAYVNSFDFRIFSAPSPRDIIEQHKKSGCHPTRFGGGLPSRPKVDEPPEEIHSIEEKYIKALLDAYSENQGLEIKCPKKLTSIPKLKGHLTRSRESFYHAESLRVFVRDKVEPGTFKSFQDEIYDGVIDTCDSEHADGFERVVAVTDKAQSIALDAHPLNKSAFPSDRRGVCHQLANEERLKWKR